MYVYIYDLSLSFFEQNCGGVPHSIKNKFIKKEKAEAKEQNVLQNV